MQDKKLDIEKMLGKSIDELDYNDVFIIIDWIEKNSIYCYFSCGSSVGFELLGYKSYTLVESSTMNRLEGNKEIIYKFADLYNTNSLPKPPLK